MIANEVVTMVKSARRLYFSARTAHPTVRMVAAA